MSIPKARSGIWRQLHTSPTQLANWTWIASLKLNNPGQQHHYKRPRKSYSQAERWWSPPPAELPSSNPADLLLTCSPAPAASLPAECPVWCHVGTGLRCLHPHCRRLPIFKAQLPVASPAHLYKRLGGNQNDRWTIPRVCRLSRWEGWGLVMSSLACPRQAVGGSHN